MATLFISCVEKHDLGENIYILFTIVSWTIYTNFTILPCDKHFMVSIIMVAILSAANVNCKCP